MDRVGSVIWKLGKGVIFVLAVIGLTGILVVRNTGTVEVGDVNVEGLIQPVKVYRDDRGVPHIKAKNLHDLFFVQGFLYAQDRGWQLEIVRRIINGELSELAPSLPGQESVAQEFYKTDLFLKQVGLKRTAKQIESLLSPSFKKIIEAYVNGLNYYINTHQDQPPIELELLNLMNGVQLKMKPWEIADTLAVQGYMALDLSLMGALMDIDRRDLTLKLGPEVVDLIFPIYYQPARNWFFGLNESEITPPSYIEKKPEGATPSSEKVPSLLTELLQFARGLGSNNWVIGPSKSALGSPILANDMHLALTTPGIWYEVHMQAPGYHVWGWALPGVPTVIAGHNEYVQWGFTNTMADVADLYYLDETPDGSGYYINGTEYKYEIFTDTIKFGNGTEVGVEVKVSKYGPMIDLGNETFAFQWPLNFPIERNNIFQAIWSMNNAKNAAEFRKALEKFSLPGQNVVFADIYGDFGYQYTGLIPIRSKGYGLIPHDGSSGEYDWVGFIPFDELYYELNPQEGFFATANQKVVPDDYPYFLSSVYAPPYRAERITQLLESYDKLSPEDMKRIQQDTYFLPFEIFKPYLGQLPTSTLTADEKEMLDLLLSWDGFANKESSGAVAFFAWLGYFEKDTWLDDLGKDLFTSGFGWNLKFALARLVENNQTHFVFDNNETETVESIDDIAVQALREANEFLRKELGSNTAFWRWGSLHKATFSHMLGNSFGFLNPRQVDADGAFYTVKVGNSPLWVEMDGELVLDFTQYTGSSERLISVVAPGFEKVYVVTPPGEIGILSSPHYDDQLLAWAGDKYFTTVFDFAIVESTFELQTTFKPSS